jgi:hypothetical protein
MKDVKPKLIIFLDFDGVFLHTYFHKVFKRIECNDGECADDYHKLRKKYGVNNKPHRKNNGKEFLNEINIYWLSMLSHYFDCSVAFSTAHRGAYDTVEEMQMTLDAIGLGSMKAMGRTGSLSSRAPFYLRPIRKLLGLNNSWDERGKEIHQYIKLKNIGKNYLIIDDSADMLIRQKKHFVKCHYEDGFNGKALIDACKKGSKLLRLNTNEYGYPKYFKEEL